MAQVSIYDGTYTSFSGADAVCTFNGQVVGEVQAITVNVQREKGPVYVLGSVNPISFSRGKRGIAGNLVFMTFDRDALMTEMEAVAKLNGTIPQFTAAGNQIIPTQILSGNDLIYAPGTYNNLPLNVEFNNLPSNTQFDAAINKNIAQGGGLTGSGTPFTQLHGEQPGEFWIYEDQIPPFDITISFANESGNAAYMVIYGAEILNEGLGISIDDINLERACTFIARDITRLRPGFFNQGQANNAVPSNTNGQNFSNQK